MVKIEQKDYCDNTLWKEVKLNNQQAFSLLFIRHYGDLVNYGKFLYPIDNHFVEDCVQDVFADFWNYREKINDSIVVKAYLLSCVRRRICRKLKKFTFFKTLNLDTDLFISHMEERFKYDDLVLKKISQLNSALRLLPQRQREIIYLCYVKNMTLNQASSVMGIRYQSSKNLIYRALQSIRKDLLLFLVFIYG
jgi:RNA polymerase sigma factor (sigma-70 family)